ncbi:MAG: Gfo/Idh/MocA family oxidoreductase [Kiritimatiellae bacterium]|nr:Gfo/Idh/MocA family oxidoreductase [Kiritimatiellia bacterium]
MTTPRLCIVGAGRLSTKRIYPYIPVAGGKLAGVCDLDPAKAQANAERFGGAPYTDMAAMLDAEKPDGVIICINAEQHAALAPLVMKRGIPVYTEKPPARSAADALKVARVSRETGVLCMTAFKKRHNTAYSRAKAFIDEFAAEDLYSLSIDYASGPYSNESFRQSFLSDFAIHAIDLAPFLFGDVAQVLAFSRDNHAYAVSLRFANGAVGSLNLTDGRGYNIPTEEVEITIKGGNVMTVHNSASWRVARQGKCEEWREPPTFISGGDSGNETGHLAELAAFLNAIREGGTTVSNIFESYKTMVLHDAIRKSADTGQVVQVVYERGAQR